jgi:hypothetical protein
VRDAVRDDPSLVTDFVEHWKSNGGTGPR